MPRGLVRTFVRRIVPGLSLLSVIAAPLAAQFPREVRGGDAPKWWMSLWGGYQWSDRVSDPGSESDWLFDQSWSTRLTAEREVVPGVSAGVAFNWTRMPLRLRSTAPGGGCTGCEGEATIASYGLMLRSGAARARSFHLVSEGFLGAMRFTSFEVEGSSPTATRAGEIADTDFTYALGVGFGYGFTRDWQGIALFETANSIHERAPEGFAQRNARHYTTRVGLRVGF